MTSNDEQDNVSYLEDCDTYTDQTFDDDYDDYYDYDDNDQFAMRRTDVVVHGLREGLRGLTDEQLIHWMVEAGLGLDFSQYVEEIERFGRNELQVRPIRVKIQTVEKRRDILRRAAETKLNQQRMFGRIYIQPYLSPRLQRLSKELRQELMEFRRDGYRNVTIRKWKVVERATGRVLYDPQKKI